MSKGRVAKFIIDHSKWTYNRFPEVDRAVVLVAPHTSMLDFVLGKMYFAIMRKRPVYFIKKELFFWPLGPILRRMGGIPVDRKRRTGVAYHAVEALKTHTDYFLVITPEGTRKKTKHWKRGFIHIAQEAGVPVLLGFFDKKTHRMGVLGELDMSGSSNEIMERMMRAYTGMEGLKKGKFCTGYE